MEDLNSRPETSFLKCTVCMHRSKNLTINDSSIRNMYSLFTGLEVSRDMWLCFICEYMLNKCFRFRSRCIETKSLISCSKSHKENKETSQLNSFSVLKQSDVFLIAIIEDNFTDGEPSFHIQSSGIWHFKNIEVKIENDDDIDIKSDVSHDSISPLDTLEVAKQQNRSKNTKFGFKESTPLQEIRKKLKQSFDDESTQITKKENEYLKELNMRLVKLTDEEQIQEIEERRKSTCYLESAYKCERCANGFAHKESYDSHIAKHEPSYGDKECEICGIRFSNVRTYWSHRTNHRRRFECLLCGRRIKERRNCGSHVASCPNRLGDSIGIACDICGKTKSNEYTLKSHRLRAHFTKKNHNCHLCAKMFVNVQALREHLILHTGERPYACDKCDSTFTTRASLQQHESVHSTSKNYYCVTCDLSFASQRRLKQHLSAGAKHITPDKLKHHCPHCVRRYHNSFDLRLHIDKVHLSLRRYACPECPLNYTAPNSLAVHVRKMHPEKVPKRKKAANTETIVKKYICDVCGSAFSSKTMLTCHTRRHTGERPLECSYCGAKFAYPAARYTHIKLVHLKLKRNTKRSKESSVCENVCATANKK